jgi:hypothetical protein
MFKSQLIKILTCGKDVENNINSELYYLKRNL